MSSPNDDLWNEFAAETEEHLDAIERLLSDRRDAQRSRDEIAALFRYFHSLKGTFLAMGFSNVETVAHRCEDILSLVRDGRSVLDNDLSLVLLRAADRLKDMREEVIAARSDAKPAADILRELDRYCEPQGVADDIPIATPPSGMPLAEDPEMLAIYSELLDQRLPIVAFALSSIANDRAAAEETAGELAHGAEMMGFEGLARQLRAVGPLAQTAGADGQRNAIILCLGELREQTGIIEEVTGIASGAVALTAALAFHLTPDYTAGLNALATAHEVADLDASQSTDLVAAAERLRAVAFCLGLNRVARLLTAIEERFRNIGILDESRLGSIREITRQSIDALRSCSSATADIDAERTDALAAQWAATFHASNALPGMATRSLLRPEVVATLSEEQRQQLETALANGRHAFELTFDLETNPDVAGDIIAWLSSAVETITSRTVYRQGASYFEFLIFSEHELDWIQSQITALDPEQVCLRGVASLSRDSEKPAEPNATAASVPFTRAPLIRVQSETIDRMMAEIGEMRIALAGFADILQRGRIATAIRDARRFGQIREKQNPETRQNFDAMEGDLNDLRTLQQSLDGAHRKIWTSGLQLRVVPVDGLLGRLSRAARDLAQKLGKDVDVVIQGREVRIDKSMVDLLIDPLMHMVRNAIDHGIESADQRRTSGKSKRAKLVIAASEHGNHIDIVIADDGKGLDHSGILAKALRLGLVAPEQAEQLTEQDITALIFRPGFSMAHAVTEISGRGVGLDVVAAAVQRLGGAINLQTSPGVGTTFTLKLPVSAALLRALLVEVDGQIFGFPERQVVAVLEVPAKELRKDGSRWLVAYRSEIIALQWLATCLGFDAPDRPSDFSQIVIASSGGHRLALRVDRVLHFQDLFLKELHPMLASVPAVAGASVLGDGSPVLILDNDGLGDEATRSHILDEVSER
jgi:two-component system, chemotaxis family, sensor kinase CheA